MQATVVKKGPVKTLAKNYYYTTDDVMAMWGCSRRKAQLMIQQLNEELIEKGYVVIRGKVSKKYYDERIY